MWKLNKGAESLLSINQRGLRRYAENKEWKWSWDALSLDKNLQS